MLIGSAGHAHSWRAGVGIWACCHSWARARGMSAGLGTGHWTCWLGQEESSGGGVQVGNGYAHRSGDMLILCGQEWAFGHCVHSWARARGMSAGLGTGRWACPLALAADWALDMSIGPVGGAQVGSGHAHSSRGHAHSWRAAGSGAAGSGLQPVQLAAVQPVAPGRQLLSGRVLGDREVTVLAEAQTRQQPAGREIGLVDPRKNGLAAAGAEKPVDQCAGGLPAEAEPVVFRVQNVAQAGCLRGNPAGRRGFLRVPGPAVPNDLTGGQELDRPAEVKPLGSGGCRRSQRLLDPGAVLRRGERTVG